MSKANLLKEIQGLIIGRKDSISYEIDKATNIIIDEYKKKIKKGYCNFNFITTRYGDETDNMEYLKKLYGGHLDYSYDMNKNIINGIKEKLNKLGLNIKIIDRNKDNEVKIKVQGDD